jgi:flagellar biosynthesis/type III secretory pathway protein FliH
MEMDSSKFSAKFSSKSFRPFGETEDAKEKDGDVTDYRMLDWSKENRPTYSQIKETFTKNAKKKDQRFFLSELVAGQLSVEEEDQRRFELRINEELEQRVAAIKEEAYKEGFEKGLEKGIEKAFEEEKARIAARLEALALVTNDLQDSKLNLEVDYEKSITEYAFAIAEAIIESEIKNRPESVSVVVANVLDLLSKEEDVKIYLGSSHKEQLPYLKEELAKLNRKGTLVIEFKDNIAPGGCIVDSIGGEVSAKISERISLFKQEIMNRFNQSDTKKAV